MIFFWSLIAMSQSLNPHYQENQNDNFLVFCKSKKNCKCFKVWRVTGKGIVKETIQNRSKCHNGGYLLKFKIVKVIAVFV